MVTEALRYPSGQLTAPGLSRPFVAYGLLGGAGLPVLQVGMLETEARGDARLALARACPGRHLHVAVP